MSLILYDLAGADPARRFSPYCWRVRLAIEHKGLSVETIPWRFTDKDVIAFSGQGRVPLLIDSGKTVVGSWAIADHLEQTYQERSSLFSGPGGKVFSRYMEFWSDSVLMPGLMPLIIVDLFNHLHYKDRVYFRSSREQKLGMSLERAGAHRESRLGEFQRSLELLRNTLRKQPFLDGDEPNYADYIVFSGFMWARCVSPFKVLQDEDPVALWRRRLLERFDVARNSPGYDT
ncbi:MAG: glutathione S-transferase family protein [Candidatus Binatus sp.]